MSGLTWLNYRWCLCTGSNGKKRVGGVGIYSLMNKAEVYITVHKYTVYLQY